MALKTIWRKHRIVPVSFSQYFFASLSDERSYPKNSRARLRR